VKRWASFPNRSGKDVRMLSGKDIKDFRNLLSHEYFGVDLEIVWKIIKDDLPALMDAVKEIVGTER